MTGKKKGRKSKGRKEMTTIRVPVHFAGLDLICELVVETWGHPGNYWDDPGEGVEFYIDEVRDDPHDFVWYFPESMYQDLEVFINNTVPLLDYAPSDNDWYD